MALATHPLVLSVCVPGNHPLVSSACTPGNHPLVLNSLFALPLLPEAVLHGPLLRMLCVGPSLVPRFERHRVCVKARCLLVLHLALTRVANPISGRLCSKRPRRGRRTTMVSSRATAGERRRPRPSRGARRRRRAPRRRQDRGAGGDRSSLLPMGARGGAGCPPP